MKNDQKQKTQQTEDVDVMEGENVISEEFWPF